MYWIKASEIDPPTDYRLKPFRLIGGIPTYKIGSVYTYNKEIHPDNMFVDMLGDFWPFDQVEYLSELPKDEENGKVYEIKPDRYKLYPHLLELKKDCENVKFDSVKYWQMRCHYLEKTIDETYTVFERDNCREFYKILANRYR